jgi:transposase
MLRCHVTAFKAFGGTARAIPYDHMKTAETGEGDRDGSV